MGRLISPIGGMGPISKAGAAAGGGGGLELLYNSGAIAFGGSRTLSNPETITINGVDWTWRGDGVMSCEETTAGLRITSSGTARARLLIDITALDSGYSDEGVYVLQAQSEITTLNNNSYCQVGFFDDPGSVGVPGHINTEMQTWGPYEDANGFRAVGYSRSNTGAYRTFTALTIGATPAHCRYAMFGGAEIGAAGYLMSDASKIDLAGTFTTAGWDTRSNCPAPDVFRATTAYNAVGFEIYGTGASNPDVKIHALEIYKVNL